MPFNLLSLFRDVCHFDVTAGIWGAACLATLRLGRMVWATYKLFTPVARA